MHGRSLQRLEAVKLGGRCWLPAVARTPFIGEPIDAALKRLTAIIRAKGKIHAFYNLNCRWGLIPDGRPDNPTRGRDVDFFNNLFQELGAEPDVRQRVCEILESALGRVKQGGFGIGSERR